MYKKVLLILLMMLLVVSKSSSESLQCKIIKITDGDTVKGVCNNNLTNIRLLGIDSYESRRNNRAYKQAYLQHLKIDKVVEKGKQATKFTYEELMDKDVILINNTSQLKDRYGRTLGNLYINGSNINEKLLNEHPDVFLKYE